MVYLVTYRLKDKTGNEQMHHDKYDESVPIKVILSSLKSRGATNVAVNKVKEEKL